MDIWRRSQVTAARLLSRDTGWLLLCQHMLAALAVAPQLEQLLQVAAGAQMARQLHKVARGDASRSRTCIAAA